MSLSLSNIFGVFLRFVGSCYNKLELLSQANWSRRILWILAVFLCFGIILCLNILTPMIGDDFGYLYVFGEKEQVGSLSDLIRSQDNHYHMWGGRSVVHFIAQGLLQMPHLLVDILNSVVYILFVFLIYLHIKGRNRSNSISLFVFINLGVWFLMPMLGDTVFWVTGSANYLWGTTIVLLFLLPYRLYCGKKRSNLREVITSLLLFIFGVIAGWTNENTVVGMVMIIILLFLHYRSCRWTIPIAYILGFLGVLIGYAIMITAPGNFVRGGDATQLSLFIVVYRLVSHTQTLFLDYGFLIILFTALFIFVYKSRSYKTEAIQLSIIYILGALASIYVMIFSPQFPSRAWFGLSSYLFIAIGILIYELNYSKDKCLRQIRFSVICIGLVAFAFSLQLAAKDIYRIYTIDKERELLAKEARDRGDKVCYFKQLKPNTSYAHGEDDGTNTLLSYYYGVYIEYED